MKLLSLPFLLALCLLSNPNYLFKEQNSWVGPQKSMCISEEIQGGSQTFMALLDTGTEVTIYPAP